MPASEQSAADTIRVLVATDNHVGFAEHNNVRKHDSWKAFDEIMNLARTEDVDMVLLAGDLFHDNQPSRWAMHQVMRTLRQNCLGNRPCELQFICDASEVFASAFPHVNYEDQDINVSIPVFSIHGNHDDPSGEGNYCSLDVLQTAGLINYFGRTPQVDKIDVKPVLLQKGSTKLALYGLSNVRDDKMHRNFRDHNVKFFGPSQQSSDWFNLLAVHQNHHAHTATSYLPEEMLPDWLNLVVWGHEHECIIDPRHNPVTGFHVMQPGSSVATSLVQGEAVAKHVAVVSITGRDFTVEKHRLKSVRPFRTAEIILRNDKRFKGIDKKKDNRQELTRKLTEVVEEMIDEANAEWGSLQDEEFEESERPLPLIRLKVEHTAVDGGHYDIENPQRFSSRFSGRVANETDVVQFWRKKTMQKKVMINDITDQETLAKLESMQVSKLVQEYLKAQSLKVLPQALFDDALSQFVDKNDKFAVQQFVEESLDDQVRKISLMEDGTEDMEAKWDTVRTKRDEMFAAGQLKRGQRRRYKPKPDDWDSDLNGEWENQPEALEAADETAQPQPARGRGRKTQTVVDEEDEASAMDVDSEEEPAPKTRGRKAATTTRAKPAPKAAAKKAPAKKGRTKKAQEEEEESDDDVFMDDDDYDPPAPPPKRTTTAKTTTTRVQPTRSQTSSRASAAASVPKTKTTRQTKLNFSQPATQQRPLEISDDEISDDPFESAPTPSRARKR
ncbi:double-strand break repair protein mus-23 [Xylariaceae sp. FL1272]|nr:double-strand break repair protein mus-23 [Xylariaceae sp. FL1272]